MSTDAQFKKGDIVQYSDGDLHKHLAVIQEVLGKNPAQYRVIQFDTNEETVCGEGIDEAGAVSAL